MDISAHLTSSCEADDKNLLIERVGDDYYRELVCESAIDPQVALEREYENSGYDWYHLVDDLGFSKWLFADHWVEPMGGCDCHGGEMTMPWWIPSGQVDLPALVVPRRSPDGETVAYEIKPKSHSFKDDRKYINPKDQGLVLDIHPRGFKHLKDTSTPIWFTEGAKKADSLTSLGLFAVNVSGVWGFMQSKLYKDGVISCFDHIEWKDRLVILAFDADAMTNPDIQDALARLNGILQERGAEVLVIYTPPVNGDNSAGIDDYLASVKRDERMHHLHLLYTQATPYAPVDVSHYRLARNPELKELILQLGDHLIKDNWKRAETPYSLFKALIREAVHKGEIVDAEVVDPEGEITVQRCVRVKASYRYLGEVIATNQKNLVTHIEKLESRGLAKRDKSVPRKIDDPSTFLLIPGLRRDYGKDVEVWRDYGKGGKEDERSALLYLSLHLALVSPHTNRLRNSTPTHTPRRGVTPGTRKVRSTNPSDKVDGISRLGKGAEYLIDMLMVWTDGGEKSISEEMLARVAHYNNRRALTTSQLFRKLRSAGIIEIKDHQVRLTPEWVTFLQIAKDEGAEDMTDQQQIESHRQQRKTFKERREVTK